MARTAVQGLPDAPVATGEVDDEEGHGEEDDDGDEERHEDLISVDRLRLAPGNPRVAGVRKRWHHFALAHRRAGLLSSATARGAAVDGRPAQGGFGAMRQTLAMSGPTRPASAPGS